MTHLSYPIPPLPDSDLAHAIAAWVQRAPRHVLMELIDSEARPIAAQALGELIAAEMTMAFPELVESSAPPLPFRGGDLGVNCQFPL